METGFKLVLFVGPTIKSHIPNFGGFRVYPRRLTLQRLHLYAINFRVEHCLWNISWVTVVRDCTRHSRRTDRQTDGRTRRRVVTLLLDIRGRYRAINFRHRALSLLPSSCGSYFPPRYITGETPRRPSTEDRTQRGMRHALKTNVAKCTRTETHSLPRVCHQRGHVGYVQGGPKSGYSV